jgi:hypothetical protein
MDFGNGFELDEADYKLTASVIIGMRIAYAFFIEIEYDIKFREFRFHLVRCRYVDLFNIDTVISSCRKSLKLPNGKNFFYIFILMNFN